MRPTASLLIAIALVAAVCGAKAADPPPFERRPLIGIWKDSNGFVPGPPYLRIAIWEDGTVIFATNATNWAHNLRQGTISADRINALKEELRKSELFALEGTCYLVPDAPVLCITVDLGKEQQMLFWDEVESPGYGINISLTPPRRAFKKCWKEVNSLALAAIPRESAPFKGTFNSVAKSWRLKRAIQSE